MAEAGNPRTWIPYMNNKDCSQGFCSLYCPQWCYIVYPPPPPFEYPEDDSSPNFSPLVIAIIGILATAFLLVSYYTLISKYCGPREYARGRDQNDAFQDNNEPYRASTVGLDEAQIKSIAVFKYKQGLNFGDCSVCLSEFEDDERVRLLPKCNHAFHVPCIDTWLRSHSNCPLCRASVFSFSNASSSNENANANANENENENESESESRTSSDDVAVVVVEEDERINHDRVYPKPALRAFSDLSGLQGRQRVIEIRDEGVCESVVRSVSMDRSFRIDQRSDVNDEEDGSSVEGCTAAEAGPSKRSRGESFGRRRLLHCVLSPIAMKRSFSSGRFSLDNKSGRGRIPL